MPFAIAGGVIVGGAMVYASNQQAKAAQSGQDVQYAMYQQNRQDLMPWMTTGSKALYALADYLGIGTGKSKLPQGMYGQGIKPFTPQDLQNYPGYQFTLQQGEQALQNRQLAQGDYFSGGAAKELSQYTTGLAQQTYGQAFNQYMQQQSQTANLLAGVAGTGQTAATQSGVLGQNAAGNITDLMGQQANAQAAGIIGAANMIQGGIYQYQNQYNQNKLYSLLSGMQQGNAGPAGGNYSYQG